jgi:hypothetical protein
MMTSFPSSLRLATLGLALLSATAVYAQTTATGAVITTGATSLGVRQTGELNFYSDGPGGVMTYGIYRDPIGDAISPGCPCEGWGVAATSASGSREAVWANQSTGSGGFGAVNSFAYTASSATSMVEMAGISGLTVRQTYGASLAADVFQVQVTITNNSGAAVNDLVYRRAMDWDVPPTEFAEYVTHSGVASNLVSNGGNVLYAGNNGFATSDPRQSATWGQSMQYTYANPTTQIDTTNSDFKQAGVDDHGSVFDFAFGSLANGASRVFNIFYGSAANESSALDKLAKLGADLFSLGQSSGAGSGGGGGGEVAVAAAVAIEGDGTAVAAAADAPASSYNPSDNATFLFGFSGVGGVELGSDQDTPILPNVVDNLYYFDAPVSGRWYDPPFASAFGIEVDGGDLFKIMAPDGFSDLTITVDGVVVDSDFDGGETFTFGAGVRSFLIGGFVVDLASAAPFPLYMEFDPKVTSMSWTPTVITTPAIPEPSTYALMALGLVGLGWASRRQRKAKAAA